MKLITFSRLRKDLYDYVCVVCPRRCGGQSKEETSQPPESEDGGEEAKNYTSVAPTMWLGAQNGW